MTTVDDIYSTIRNMSTDRKVFGDKEKSKCYGIDSFDIISYEYNTSGNSSLNIVCPRDPENNFMYVEINNDGMFFTKVFKGGINYEPIECMNVETFFQEDTIINLGFSFDDYKTLEHDFNRYYNGFLKELTIYL